MNCFSVYRWSTAPEVVSTVPNEVVRLVLDPTTWAPGVVILAELVFLLDIVSGFLWYSRHSILFGWGYFLAKKACLD